VHQPEINDTAQAAASPLSRRGRSANWHHPAGAASSRPFGNGAEPEYRGEQGANQGHLDELGPDDIQPGAAEPDGLRREMHTATAVVIGLVLKT
jgi:hypothetical protein